MQIAGNLVITCFLASWFRFGAEIQHCSSTTLQMQLKQLSLAKQEAEEKLAKEIKQLSTTPQKAGATLFSCSTDGNKMKIHFVSLRVCERNLHVLLFLLFRIRTECGKDSQWLRKVVWLFHQNSAPGLYDVKMFDWPKSWTGKTDFVYCVLFCKKLNMKERNRDPFLFRLDS